MSTTTRPEQETKEKATKAIEAHAAILEKESEKRSFEIALEIAHKRRVERIAERKS